MVIALSRMKRLVYKWVLLLSSHHNLRSTLAYGALFADDGTDYARLNDGANEKVQQAWINFIYSPVKPVDLGIEYINGERETFEGEKFSDDRVGFMARYSF